MHKCHSTHLYTWVQRGTVRVKVSCPRTQHNVSCQDSNPDRSIRRRAQNTKTTRPLSLPWDVIYVCPMRQHFYDNCTYLNPCLKWLLGTRLTSRYAEAVRTKTKQNNMDQENTLELQTDWSDLILYNNGGSSNTNSSSSNNNKTWHALPVTVAVNVTVRSLIIIENALQWQSGGNQGEGF